jgi:hypothetical protein
MFTPSGNVSETTVAAAFGAFSFCDNLPNA